jgi:hypothetical protein
MHFLSLRLNDFLDFGNLCINVRVGGGWEFEPRFGDPKSEKLYNRGQPCDLGNDVTTTFGPGGHEDFMERFFDLVFRDGDDGNVSSHHVSLTTGDGRYFGITSFVTFSQSQVMTRNPFFISCPEVSRHFLSPIFMTTIPKKAFESPLCLNHMVVPLR